MDKYKQEALQRYLKENNPFPNWQIKECLGTGSYGAVFKAIKSNGDISAIRIVNNSDKPTKYKTKESIKQSFTKKQVEINALKELSNHTHILSMYDSGNHSAPS